MKKRILHSMLRVKNLEQSIYFYTNLLGMKVIRTFDNPKHQYTLVYLGYGEEESSTVLELTYNYDTDYYDLGTGFGHIAIGVEDCYKLCDKIDTFGGRIVRPPGPLIGGTETIAFIEDPDGYRIELIERESSWF